MTPQDYILSKLDDLAEPSAQPVPANDYGLQEAIFRAVMSKKFRKYSANDTLVEHVREAIRVNVEQRHPINFTFLHGAYKLWRLKESPEADWAELFALMYYTRWVKAICEIYEPGVWFDFFVDDLIVPKIDNIPLKDIHTYISSYQAVMDFLKPYQPKNLKMTITPVGSRFESPEAFDQSLTRSLAKLIAATPGGLPQLTAEQRASVELNTKVTLDQTRDPLWKEKVYHLHNAYMATKAEPGYHKNRPEKILVFTQPLPSGTMISVGTTKDSVMKFWVGAGVLRPKVDSYRQLILSPAQLEETSFEFVDMEIPKLTGKNFKRIRILK
ncbi:MAG TPA: hypothetical protein VGH44_01350 [Candidatus Saccharimonadia bacterium]|jgi:hypothetical protein